LLEKTAIKILPIMIEM
jgi:hypothetical protein